MRAGAIAEVIESKAASLPKGTLVQTYQAGWSEYLVQDAAALQPLQNIPGVSPTHYLGALGMTGLTAYYGTKIIAAATPEDVLIVSGAAGATGSMVVQVSSPLACGDGMALIIADCQEARWLQDGHWHCGQ